MGFCMDNCKIRNVGRNHSNHPSKMKGLSAISYNKMKRFYSQCIFLCLVIPTAAKKPAQNQECLERAFLKGH